MSNESIRWSVLAGAYMFLVGAVLSIPLGLGIQTTIPFPLQFGVTLGLIGGLCWGGFVEYPSRYRYLRGAGCGALAGIVTVVLWLWFFAFVLAGLPLEALSAGALFLLKTLSVIGGIGALTLGLPMMYARRRDNSPVERTDGNENDDLT
ncbi:hypothetical protein [Halonotius roseus]|uniref:Uncharacterized protein n=1 Tax=Halonotius roseus TaxID=2511997 RepID=A0A544QQS7_9EURY|nr:hypothetical protein [Halonotius roseus]TQQ81786.1 hypothetical protein EWF95_02300 [Halonotius roseus]